METEFTKRGKVDISRFKGLGEMLPRQLKETAMDPASRSLLQVEIADDDRDSTAKSVQQLMGNKAEARFKFIQENAEFAKDLDI
jgi:topoisomerase-4 subunit B